MLLMILNAFSGAMILVLAALGLGIIYGQMNVLNLAHGEFFMLGAYAVVITDTLNLSPIVGILFAPIFVGAIGILIERILIKPLYKRPLDTLLSTWGLAIVLKQSVQLTFGAKQRSVKPLFIGSMNIFGVNYPIYRIFIIVATLVVVALVFIMFYKTSFGLRMRMVIQNREQASAMGINTDSVDRWAFALGSALAGFAGAIMTPLMFINPELGSYYLASSFIVVIIGGISSLFGLAAAGITVGFAKILIDFVVKNFFLTYIIVLLIAVGIIRLRPKGLFYRSRS